MRNMIRDTIRNRFRCMKKRCYDKTDKDYHNYGGRGIVICNEWLNDFDKFLSWCLNNGFEYRLTIDRIDTNGNYAPDNCRFVSRKEQNRNLRKNVSITAFNETKLLLEWIDDPRCVVEYGTLYGRLKRGISPEVAITKPPFFIPFVSIGKQKTRKFIRNSHVNGNYIITIYGESKSIRAWSEDKRCKISLAGLTRRIRTGWNFEAAIKLNGMMREV